MNFNKKSIGNCSGDSKTAFRTGSLLRSIPLSQSAVRDITLTSKASALMKRQLDGGVGARTESRYSKKSERKTGRCAEID